MKVSNTEIEIVVGDITKMEVDAIVNAANSSLMGGGGVDGAIHRAGGKQILEDCQAIVYRQGKCRTGEAVITRAGNLSAKYVIHTVGPIWSGGKNQEAAKLANCYANSLRLAVENGCSTIAFPNISTGVYRFPKQEAAEVAHAAVLNFIQSHSELKKIVFVCFDSENYTITHEVWQE